MQNGRGASALAAYRSVGIEASIEGAGRHQLVSLMLNGAMEGLARSKGLMLHGDIAGKGQLLGQVLGIIAGLRACLDLDNGGELAARLDSLYDYMERRVGEANMDNRCELLDEVHQLLGEIRAGWEAIAGGVEVVE